MSKTRIYMFGLAAFSLLAVASTACKPALLPGTEIEDTEDTRAVYDVLEAYQAGVEKRDADAVLALVHPEYFETAGTEDPADDYGYEELKLHLRDDFERSLVIRLDLHLKQIEVEDDQARVTYRYQSRSQVNFPAGEQWVTKTDVNMMKLRRVDESWKIISGL